MPIAFRLTKDATQVVSISGVGVLTHEGGVALEDAALQMAALQDEDGKPLTGDKLEAAARAYIADNPYAEVANVAEAKLDQEETAGDFAYRMARAAGQDHEAAAHKSIDALAAFSMPGMDEEPVNAVEAAALGADAESGKEKK